jgi:hypothetical protein
VTTRSTSSRIPTCHSPRRTGWEKDGRTILHVLADGDVIGSLALEDEIRPESYEAIKEIHELGLKVAMITGDSRAVADSVARRLGIDEDAAQVLPADKAAAVRRFQEGGRMVGVVGDEVNDSPPRCKARDRPNRIASGPGPLQPAPPREVVAERLRRGIRLAEERRATVVLLILALAPRRSDSPT